MSALDSTRPRPVVNAAKITSAIRSVILVMSFLGFNQAADWLSAQSAALVSVGVVVFEAGISLYAAIQAQKKVTPVDDAKDAQGNQLVAASSAVLSPVVLAEQRPPKVDESDPDALYTDDVLSSDEDGAVQPSLPPTVVMPFV